MAKFRFVDTENLGKDPFAVQETQENDFEKLLGQSEAVGGRKFKTGETVQGEVIRVGSEYIFVDLGGKATGSLALDELDASFEIPKVGETFSAYVRADNGSEILLTKSLKKGEADTATLFAAYESQIPVEAKIDKVIKGGFQATVCGQRAFIPLGHVSSQRIENPDSFLGLVLPFHISEFKQGGKNIVLSRRLILKDEQNVAVKNLLQTLEVGSQIQGTVTRFAPFGVFVDIGGVDGLVSLSELSWKRVKSGEDVVKLGEKVFVKVLKIEQEPKLRISLSLKEAGEDPWVLVSSRIVEGSKISAKATRLTDFGAFFEVDGGIEGLVHISQLTWEKRVKHPSEIVKEGELYDLHVLGIDTSAKKLSLSLKGPMSEDQVKALRSKGTEIDAQERESLQQWDNYNKAKKDLPQTTSAASNIFASAFSVAKKKQIK